MQESATFHSNNLGETTWERLGTNSSCIVIQRDSFPKINNQSFDQSVSRLLNAIMWPVLCFQFWKYGTWRLALHKSPTPQDNIYFDSKLQISPKVWSLKVCFRSDVSRLGSNICACTLKTKKERSDPKEAAAECRSRPHGMPHGAL